MLFLYQLNLYFQMGNAIAHKAWIPNRTKHQLNRFRGTFFDLLEILIQSRQQYFYVNRFSRSYLLNCFQLQSLQKYLLLKLQLKRRVAFLLSILERNQYKFLLYHLPFSKLVMEFPNILNGINSNH